MKLTNKIALVTGATGQLGSEFCKSLALQGASVIVTDIDIDKCTNLTKNLNNSEKHKPQFMDVSNSKSVAETFSKLNAISKVPDIIINNAGIAVFSSYEKRNFSDFMKVLKVNAGGTFLCIKEGSKMMRKHQMKGSIINIGSIHGMVSGDPRIYTDCDRATSECYGASKAAIIHMTKYFAIHLAEFGIRVNCISPGGVFNNQGENFVENYNYRTPMGRMANAKEIANAVTFFASEESSYITGQNLAIDGGWTSW